MCEICQQAHRDLTTTEGVQVCTSKRQCLLWVLRHASELQIARMHTAALETALAGSQVVSSRVLRLAGVA